MRSRAKQGTGVRARNQAGTRRGFRVLSSKGVSGRGRAKRILRLATAMRIAAERAELVKAGAHLVRLEEDAALRLLANVPPVKAFAAEANKRLREMMREQRMAA